MSELTKAELELLEGIEPVVTPDKKDALTKEWVNEEERKAFVRERIIACIKEGKSANQVATETGASIVHVKQLFKKLGVDWRTVQDLDIKVHEQYSPNIEEELEQAEIEAEEIHTNKPSVSKLLKTIREIYSRLTPLRAVRVRFYKDKAIQVLTEKNYTAKDLQDIKLTYMLIRPVPSSINNNKDIFEFHKELLRMFEK